MNGQMNTVKHSDWLRASSQKMLVIAATRVIIFLVLNFCGRGSI
jgi:hypothetical protein